MAIVVNEKHFNMLINAGLINKNGYLLPQKSLPIGFYNGKLLYNGTTISKL